MKALFYPGGGTGIGNIVRLSRVALILKEKHPDAEILQIVGNPYHRELWQPSVPTFHFLPELLGFTASNAISRVAPFDHRPSIPALTTRLAQVVKDFRPELFVTSRFTGLSGELIGLYPLLRKLSCRVVLGWRDILASSDSAALLNEYIDQVVVFGVEGHQPYVPLERLPSRLKRTVNFLGYVPPVDRSEPQARKHHSPRNPESARVLCQVGGGIDGEKIINSCLAAVNNLSGKLRKVEVDIARGVFGRANSMLNRTAQNVTATATTWRQLGQSRFTSYDLQIAMAGYNTCVESAFFGVPTILLPREQRGDEEQLLRAHLFSKYFANMSVFRLGSSKEAEHSLSELIIQVLSKTKQEVAHVRGPFFGRPKEIVCGLLGG